jgi:DNA polymerase III delta subunit
MRKFQKEQLQQMLTECITLEESIKTGRIGDQIAVELFIIRHTK